MALRAAISRDGHRGLRGCLIEWHRDVMNAMTVRAYRSARHAPGDRLSVNAPHKFRGFGSMTLSAGGGNIDFRNR